MPGNLEFQWPPVLELSTLYVDRIPRLTIDRPIVIIKVCNAYPHLCKCGSMEALYVADDSESPQ